jgi:hypothetical protein
MSKTLFQFGERIPGYSVAVFNERAVRAAAGILFFFAMVTFMNAMLLGNFQPTRVFVVAFLIDFTLRIFVNPKFSPSLILGQWIVRKQEPEYVGAPQKRFAWAIGFILAMLMLYMIVIKGLIGPINMLVCGTCLLLLFFESAFGICIGCKLYDRFSKNKVELCPGNVCSFNKLATSSNGNCTTDVNKGRFKLQVSDWLFFLICAKVISRFKCPNDMLHLCNLYIPQYYALII